jgi:aryl-alcohol dehydrogenase-like predicted oxidoreductase
MKDIHRRPLGRTGISVSPIGLGAWQFSQGKGGVGRYWGSLEQETVRSVLREALAGGVDWIDTAEVYGWGRSEESVADALKANGASPEQVLVATKWFPLFRTAASIESTIHERLSRLGGWPISLHQVHLPTSLSPIPAQMRAMASLVRQGLVRAVGVSNFSESQMRLAHSALADLGIPLASNQVRYSLLDRSVETNGVLDAARELGVTIVAYSPLAQGLLSGRYHADPTRAKGAGARKLTSGFRARGLRKTEPVIAAVREIAESHAVPPAQVALAWLLARGEDVVAIPGAKSVEQARSNAASMRLELGSSEAERLDAVSRP